MTCSSSAMRMAAEHKTQISKNNQTKHSLTRSLNRNMFALTSAHSHAASTAKKRASQRLCLCSGVVACGKMQEL